MIFIECYEPNQVESNVKVDKVTYTSLMLYSPIVVLYSAKKCVQCLDLGVCYVILTIYNFYLILSKMNGL